MRCFRGMCWLADLFPFVKWPRVIWPLGLAVAALIYAAQPAAAQFIQQGPKLVGGGAVNAAQQGASVALSADGNTAIIGGPFDNSLGGTAWVFIRSAGAWVQQAKLVGTGAIGAAGQGISVALSADGNTAIVGGYQDNSNVGAAWVFTRSGGVWTQQGSKLVGTGAVGAAQQGHSVALSADGNTAIVGGNFDNSGTGTAWVFTRSGGMWTQQFKVVGTGAIGPAGQGYSVSLSADGNTAAMGGFDDNGNAGATWIFTRSGGVWTQQGDKLVGAGALGPAGQGISVALSADGNTLIVGGYTDNDPGAPEEPGAGAAWVWTRNAGAWTQQGNKLIGTGAVGSASQGISVSLSADGNLATIGGPADNAVAGAAWVFTRSGGVWHQLGAKLVGTGAVGSIGASQGVAVALAADGNTVIVGGPADNGGSAGATWVFASHAAHDFNGDHVSDILWRHTNGSMTTWQMAANGTHTAFNFGVVPTAWQIAGTTSLVASTGDVDGDGKSDIFWRHTNGSLSLWEMNGGAAHTPISLGTVATAWQITGVGDFDGDGIADILWRHTNGSLSIWKMAANGSHTALNFGVVATAWQVAGIGDVNGDGKADIVWRHSNGSLSIWQMNGGTSHTALNLGAVVSAWQIVGVGDVDKDGNADLFWRHTNGSLSIWKMAANGTHTALNLGTVATAWQIVSIGDYNNDGHADILWRHTNGSASIWKMNANGTHTALSLGSVATAWTIVE